MGFTYICVFVRHGLDKFITLGWIIVCLFDWCGLHPFGETKNYLYLHFTIWLLISSCLLCIGYYYSLTLLSFFCFLIPDWFDFKCFFAFLLFWGTNAFPQFKLVFLWLCWFLESAGVGYSFYLSYFVLSFAAPSLFVLVWLELLLLLLSLLLLYQFCLRPFYVLLLLLSSLACLFACLGFLSTELLPISAVLFDIRLPII